MNRRDCHRSRRREAVDGCGAAGGGAPPVGEQAVKNFWAAGLTLLLTHKFPKYLLQLEAVPLVSTRSLTVSRLPDSEYAFSAEFNSLGRECETCCLGRLLLSRMFSWDRLGVLFALVFLLVGGRTDSSAQVSVRVAWDPNPETNIQGYRIYYGRSAGGPTNLVDVGNQTSGAVTNLAYAAGYFFFVTAYNTFGLESDPSSILTYKTPPVLSLSMDPQLIALTPSEITLRPRLTGYRAPGTEVLVSWRETSSSGLSIQDANTLTPRVTLTTPGNYGFEVTVTVGTVQFVTATSVLAIDGTTEPNRGDPIILSYTRFPLDEVVYFYWNTRSDRSYAFTYTRNLTDRVWVPVTLFFPGYSDHTVTEAWMAEHPTAFFTVIEGP